MASVMATIPVPAPMRGYLSAGREGNVTNELCATGHSLPNSKMCRASVLKSDSRRSNSIPPVSAPFPENNCTSQELSPIPLSHIFYGCPVSGVKMCLQITVMYGGGRTLSRSKEVCSMMSNTIGRS